MIIKSSSLLRNILHATLAITSMTAFAQEDVIRRNLSERYPTLPKADAISKTPVNGIYEIRIGNEFIYADSQADFIFQGILIDAKTQKNLTESRKEELLKIDAKHLPLANAFTRVQGNGQRKLYIFADPNCGFCKQLEKNLGQLKNVTIYFFLLPVLGDDSYNKSQHVWCAKDKDAVWTNWMISGVVPPAASCNMDAISSNLEFAKKYRITGTPTTFLSNGKRVMGAVPIAQLDKLLDESQ